MKFNRSIITIFILCVLSSNVITQTSPIELGEVNWLRNYEESLDKAHLVGKDILILFQEIPGCSTCRKFGSNILSDPFVVEIIETYFVPLAIYNNKKGADLEVLKMYEEPTWNNPVLRIVNHNGDNQVDRFSGNYTKSGVLDFLYNYLANKMEVPLYIKLLREELYLTQNGLEDITFSMYCFWTGEKELGQVEGVVNTRSGFMNGKEVVKVTYSPTIVSQEQLMQKAKDKKCADQVFTNNIVNANVKQKYQIKPEGKFRLDKDQKYYLKNSKYASIPMFELQASRVNSALGNQKNPEVYLSPRQLLFLTK